MKYITHMGGIWKLSEKSFQRLLADLQERKATNLDDYGKMISLSLSLRHLEDLAYDYDLTPTKRERNRAS